LVNEYYCETNGCTSRQSPARQASSAIMEFVIVKLILKTLISSSDTSRLHMARHKFQSAVWCMLKRMPYNYYNQQWVCCETAPLGCRSAPTCTSHDPTRGETPCCTPGGIIHARHRKHVQKQAVKTYAQPRTRVLHSIAINATTAMMAYELRGATIDRCGANCTKIVATTFTVTDAYGCDEGPIDCQTNGGTYIQELSCLISRPASAMADL